MIKPTVGIVVLYKPLSHERQLGDDGTGRWPALVCYVWSDTMVNLAVFDPNGIAKPHTSVTLAQDAPAEEGQCEWMPFQIGQAAQTESVLKRFENAIGADVKAAEASIEKHL